MIGHPQGASGAAGVVATALALSRHFLPPTINQTQPDPDCDLDFIPNRGRAASPVAALCNCLGFGSKNSALVLGRADSPQRANSRVGAPKWMTLPLREQGRQARWLRPFSRRPACASACSIARAFHVTNSAATR